MERIEKVNGVLTLKKVKKVVKKVKKDSFQDKKQKESVKK